jgi:CHAT domain
MADYVAAQARVAEVEEDRQAPPELLGRTRRTARTLDRLGWSTEATHVRTLLGRVALSLDRPDVVRAELGRITRPGRGATVDARTTAWHATALHRLARGDRPGAKRALRRGLTLVDWYRAGAVSTELRAAAGARATELGRLGLRLALQDGSPAEVLRWAERWRAGSLRLPPVVPPADAALADLAAALVEARAAMRESALGGHPDPAAARRVARIERALRHRNLQVAGPSSAAVAVTGFDLPALRARLGPATLVEYVALERRLWAVTVRSDGQQLHDLGPVESVLVELRFLLSALRRQNAAAVRGQGVVTAAPPVAPSPAADRLDAVLLRPLALDPASPLVIVPTGGLHGLPWAALPSAFLRPVTIAPSADLWLRRGSPHSRSDAGAVALIAGPDLPGATAEVHRLAAVYPDAQVLTGAAATVDATLDAFARHDLVHIAAHGQFRADSPLFSSLQLADGHLTVYDLERLHAATPATVVLPACDAARADVRLGDEVIGTTTALLVRGVRAVVAPLVPVPDDTTADLMVALHERLRAGLTPSDALAAAASSCSPESLSAWSSFVCVGTAGS